MTPAPTPAPRRWYAVEDPLFGTTRRYTTLSAAHKAFDALLMKPEFDDVWAIPDWRTTG